jgi:hypothetical protein
LTTAINLGPIRYGEISSREGTEVGFENTSSLQGHLEDNTHTLPRRRVLKLIAASTAAAALLPKDTRMDVGIAPEFPVCSENIDIDAPLVPPKAEYPLPCKPADSYVDVIQTEKKTFYFANPLLKEIGFSRPFALQNLLDWVAIRHYEDLENAVVVLREGIHYLPNRPLVLRDIHSGMTLCGEAKTMLNGEIVNLATIDAQHQSRHVFVEGNFPNEKCVDVTIAYLNLENGFPNGKKGERIKSPSFTDPARPHSIWSLLDGGSITVVRGAQFTIFNCNFYNCQSPMCGGVFSVDTAESFGNVESRIVGCKFTDCGLVPCGLGTGRILDVLRGGPILFADNVIGNASEKNTGGSYPYDNGDICGFSDAIVIVQDNIFKMTPMPRMLISHGVGTVAKGAILIKEGNRVIVPDSLTHTMHCSDVVRPIIQSEQPVPQEAADYLRDTFMFYEDPQTGNWGEVLIELNPGVARSGTGYWLQRREWVDTARIVGVPLIKPFLTTNDPIFLTQVPEDAGVNHWPLPVLATKRPVFDFVSEHKIPLV